MQEEGKENILPAVAFRDFHNQHSTVNRDFISFKRKENPWLFNSEHEPINRYLRNKQKNYQKIFLKLTSRFQHYKKKKLQIFLCTKKEKFKTKNKTTNSIQKKIININRVIVKTYLLLLLFDSHTHTHRSYKLSNRKKQNQMPLPMSRL